MRENNNIPYSGINSANDTQRISPQQKSINLLPAVPIQTSRKLSDREQRDCDVIGKDKVLYCIILLRHVMSLHILIIRIDHLQKDL